MWNYTLSRRLRTKLPVFLVIEFGVTELVGVGESEAETK